MANVQPEDRTPILVGCGQLVQKEKDVEKAKSPMHLMADAARHMPAAGEMNTQAAPAAASTVTRAQVREATRDAIAHGYRPASGESA